MLQYFAAPFVFQLSLTNALGRSASTSVSVSKSALPLFPIYLSGPAVQSVRRASPVAQLASTDYTLAASTVCGATVASMSVQFAWRQLQSSGEAAAAMGATMMSSVVSMSPSLTMAVANETIGVDLSRATLAIPAQSLRVGFVYGAIHAGQSNMQFNLQFGFVFPHMHPYCISVSPFRTVFQVSLAVTVTLAQQTKATPSLVSTSTVAFVVQPSDLVARITGGDRTFWCVFVFWPSVAPNSLPILCQFYDGFPRYFSSNHAILHWMDIPVLQTGPLRMLWL
jgi:hypothetical protein